VHATAVTGHSSGEIAAAYAAGAVSRYTAVGLAWYRGCFAAAIEQNETLKGAMLAVRAGGDEISSLIRTLPKTKGTIGIACYNSPKNCTISGDQTEIEKLQVILESKNIGFTKLRINVAYHSPHMQSIASAYLKAIIPLTEMKGIQISPAWDAVPFFSSVCGNIMHPNMLGSEYWVSNLVNPVKFTDAIQSLIRCTSKDTIGHGNGLFVEGFVEIGPHTALRAYIMETCSKEAEPVSLPYFNLLRRKQDAFRTAFTALGEMWCLGYDLNMYNINETGARVKLLVDLPPYPFNHSTSYSQESVIAKEYRLRAHPRTDLLGYSYPGALFPQWRNFLRLSENPWIADHKVGCCFQIQCIAA
jgi:acyl transferase domain-containing protein